MSVRYEVLAEQAEQIAALNQYILALWAEINAERAKVAALEGLARELRDTLAIVHGDVRGECGIHCITLPLLAKASKALG